MDKGKHNWNVNAKEFVPRARLGDRNVSRIVQIDPEEIVRQRYKTELNNCKEIMEWATEDDVKNLQDLGLQFRRIPVVLIADVYHVAKLNVQVCRDMLKEIEPDLEDVPDF